MRKSFDVNDVWSCRDGETEPSIPSQPPVVVVDDEVNQDEIETLRDIKTALEYVEAHADCEEAIESCTSSVRRSEFVAAPPISDQGITDE